MKNKIIILVVAAIFFGGIWVGYNSIQPKEDDGIKEVHIIIEDAVNNKVLYDQVVETEVATLGELLDEREDIEVVFTETRFITAMMGAAANWDEDKSWWGIFSDNNKDCKSAGFCSGVDIQNIYDGDNFTFKLGKGN